jgi:hypothetical protein
MNPLFVVCIILAIVFFILSAVPPTRARYDFIPLGLIALSAALYFK